MSVKRSWKVYGKDGCKQRESYNASCRFDFSDEQDGTRIIEIQNSDKTGTNDYSIITITRNTYQECETELAGQLTDGCFENSKVGKIEEILM